MSHSIHIDSFEHTKPRYANTAKVAVDPLAPTRHDTLVAPIFPQKRELSNEGTVVLGNEVIYKFPTQGYVHNVSIKNNWAQTTTASMSLYRGASSIKEVELNADGETLQKFHFKPAFEYYMSKFEEEAVDKILLAVGSNFDTTTATSTTITPIPLFFDPFLVPGVEPLNLGKFKTQPELRITYETATNCTLPTGTGASITASKLVLYMSETAPVLKNMHNKDDYYHKSIDFYTNVNNNISNTTETSVDISGFKGQQKRLYLKLGTQANKVTNKVYFGANQEIDYLKTDWDGHQEDVFKHKEEAELDYIFYNHGKGASTALGYGQIIPLSYHLEKKYGTNNVGGVHSSKINKNQLVVYHSIGATCVLDVLGVISALFMYDNGTMVKKR